jgi:hypothetical protein
MNQSATNEKSGIQATLELCTPSAALSTRSNAADQSPQRKQGCAAKNVLRD